MSMSVGLSPEQQRIVVELKERGCSEVVVRKIDSALAPYRCLLKLPHNSQWLDIRGVTVEDALKNALLLRLK